MQHVKKTFDIENLQKEIKNRLHLVASRSTLLNQIPEEKL